MLLIPVRVLLLQSVASGSIVTQRVFRLDCRNREFLAPHDGFEQGVASCPIRSGLTAYEQNQKFFGGIG